MAESSTAERLNAHTFTAVRSNDGAGSGPARPAAILLVDDKPELLDSLHQLVTLHGYSARQGARWPEAIDLLRATCYDVVLLDLIMPGVSGHDVLEFAAREGCVQDHRGQRRCQLQRREARAALRCIRFRQEALRGPRIHRHHGNALRAVPGGIGQRRHASIG
jgi:CheY-like chemotaxis protein